MSKKTENLVKGFYDVCPLLLPVVPFGIIFGAIGIELGFGPYITYATSIIIFSGASQIVFFQLLSNGASPIIAITSSSVVSTRHLLYGAVVAQYLSKLSGILLGSIVPEELGLTFTIPLTFLALLVNYFRKIDHLFVIFISGLLSIIFYEAPFKSYIILSSLLSLLAIFLFLKFQKKI